MHMTKEQCECLTAGLTGIAVGAFAGYVFALVVIPLQKAGVIKSCQPKGPVRQLRERPWATPPPVKPSHSGRIETGVGMWSRRCLKK